MYLMYIDESGDTIPISQGGKNFLVLTGCVIDENNKIIIDKDFRKIKRDYYQNEEVEIKSNFLRYANPDLLENSPIKLNDRKKYDDLEGEIADFLKKIPVSLFSVVIDKKGFWKKYPAQNPYNTAYVFLLERFQKFLEEKESFGISIIDLREGQVEKSFIGNELDFIHNELRWGTNPFNFSRKLGGFWNKCPNIIEKLLFSSSDKTIGIQISDLYCYPIFHIFQYNKKGEEYWRFKEITLPKTRNKEGKIDGIGLKFFPKETKKDLRYFDD